MSPMDIQYENLSKTNKVLFDQYKSSFGDFVEKGWYILGENVRKFENNFAKYCNSDFCTGVASGLDALIIAIDSLGLEEGSEIIVPSNTYIATILAIIKCKHIPILVEPNIKTYNIDPELILEKINKKTKAIIVVHLYGKPCEMDKIQKVSQEFDLKIIEDCAQAHGAKYKEKKK